MGDVRKLKREEEVFGGLLGALILPREVPTVLLWNWCLLSVPSVGLHLHLIPHYERSLQESLHPRLWSLDRADCGSLLHGQIVRNYLTHIMKLVHFLPLKKIVATWKEVGRVPPKKYSRIMDDGRQLPKRLIEVGYPHLKRFLRVKKIPRFLKWNQLYWS